MTLREIERVLYFEAFVVVDPGMTLAPARQLLTTRCISSRSRSTVRVRRPMGAEAVHELPEVHGYSRRRW